MLHLPNSYLYIYKGVVHLIIICSKEFKKILQKQGIKFKTGTKVTGAKIDPNTITLTAEPRDGGAQEQVRFPLSVPTTITLPPESIPVCLLFCDGF